MRLNEEEFEVMKAALRIFEQREHSTATEKRQLCVARQLLRRNYEPPEDCEEDEL